MTATTTVLSIGAGIQRDGTQFAAPCYVDGQWVRFQAGKPRKIGGYSGSFLNAPSISRGMILQSQNGFTTLFSGFSNSIQQWTINNNDSIGTGPAQINPLGPLLSLTITTGGSGYANGTYTNVIPVMSSGLGSNATFTVIVSGGIVTTITITNAGNGYKISDTFTLPTGSIGGGSPTTLFSGSVATLNYYSPNANTLWQFDSGFDPNGTNQLNLIAHPGQNLQYIDNTINSRPLIGNFSGTTLSAVGVFNATATTTSGSNYITFSSTNIAISAGISVSGTGIPSNTTVTSSNYAAFGPIGITAINTGGASYTSGTFTNVPVVGKSGLGSGGLVTAIVSAGVVTSISVTAGGSSYLLYDTFTLPSLAAGTGFQGTISAVSTVTSNLWTAVLNNASTASGSASLVFDNNISVSGGVVMLYPYLFVYGNNGLIQNCSAGNFNNWTSADSNSNNVSATKIVKGLPLRGGTTSPSGLFWSLESLIRVSYSPQSAGTSTLYWKYDIISSQTSIMSSQCVIEYDGIYYWAGVDRFLMYNGVVQEIPNNQNQNWFFDGLNNQQRQKVWVSKVPRWGEIWWFYPRGNSTECNDAIIYNVREKCWYDAGMAPGASRSAGTFSEVFRKPIWAGNTPNTVGGNTLWTHEQGTDQIYLNNDDAILSYFETNAIGSNVGLVGTVGQPGENLWTRLERIEPDFVQYGSMSVVITGKGYADDTDIASTPYVFLPSTLKIDMLEQRREMRLRFISNTQNGDYYLGRTLLDIDTGDTRGTGNP